jgi:hypothetical protein
MVPPFGGRHAHLLATGDRVRLALAPWIGTAQLDDALGAA